MHIEILHYTAALAPFFKSINLEWLNYYYSVTPEDLVILDHPEKIIEEGGSVLFVSVDNVIVGTAALKKNSDDSVELIKMGVLKQMQGKGLGRILLEALVEESKMMNAKRITLETAVPLKAAISLYSKLGFVQTSSEEVHPVFGRVTFKMEKNLE